MTEQTGQTSPEQNDSQQTEAEKAFEPITSQEALDKIVQARVARERSKFADYDQMKAAAAELQTIRDAQKSEAEKAADALSKAQQELAGERTARLRAEVAAEKKVPVTLLSGATREELEAAADELIKFKGVSNRLVVPGEGKQPAASGGTTRDVFADFRDQFINNG